MKERKQTAQLIFLALFFLGGVILGQVFAGMVSPEVGEEIRQYLSAYIRAGGQPAEHAVWPALLLYFRFPLLAFFLGFASLGVVALPVVTGLFGCVLSFSVCCFTATFGSDGILLALAVLGLRCALVLPCYFLLAVPSMKTAALLARLTVGSGKWPYTSAVYGKSYWLRLCVCTAVLLLGVFLELHLNPPLLRIFLKHLLT